MTDVFISYSRKDIAFARLIRSALEQAQVDTWIDWERIPIGERWWQEITEAIQSANVFIFIISKHSIQSTVCKDEIYLAIENHKRIIPIIVDNLNPTEVSQFAEELPKFNWIIFERDQIFRVEENPLADGDKLEDRFHALPQMPQFEKALEKLSAAIHTDWNWVKYHTRLQIDALQWDGSGRNQSYLIRGAELAEAEQALIHAAGKEPQPSELQATFVTASRQEETLRQAEQATLEGRSRRRQQFALWAVGIGLVVALVLGIAAWSQRNQYLAETHVRATAESNAVSEANSRATAEANAVTESLVRATAQAVAEDQRDRALARQIAAQALDLVEREPDLAALLSAQSVSLGGGAVAENSLLRTISTYPQLAQVLISELDGSPMYNLAFSPDGRWLVSNGREGGNEIWLWAVDSTARLPFVSIKKPLYAGEDYIENAFFSPDSQQLVLAGRQFTLIYDLETFAMQTIATDEWFSGLFGTFWRFTPDGQELAALNKDKLFYWNPRTGDLRFTTFAGLDGLSRYSIIIDPYMQVAGVKLTDVSLNFYDVASGQPLQDASVIEGFGYSMVTNFSRDGSTLLMTNTAGELSLWDVMTQSLYYERNIVPGTLVQSLAAEFAPYGSILAIGTELGSINVLDPSWTMYQFEKTHLWKNSPLPDDLIFLREGLNIAGPPVGISSLSFSPDGRYLVVGTELGAAYVYEIRPEPYSFSDQAFGVDSFQETHSATAYLDSAMPLAAIGGCVKMGDPFCLEGGFTLWNLTERKPLRGMQSAHEQEISQVAFSPDGKILATCGQDNIILLWDVETGSKLPISLSGLNLECENMRFNLDGSMLAVTHSLDGANNAFLTLNIPSGEIQEVIYRGITSEETNKYIRGYAFTREPKKVVALIFGLGKSGEPPALINYDLTTGEIVGEAVPVNWSYSLTFDADSGFLVFWSQNMIYAYDWNTGQPIGTPVNFQEDITSVAIKPGTHTIAVTVFHPQKAFTLMDMDKAQIIGATFKPSPSVDVGFWFVNDELFFNDNGSEMLLVEPRVLTLFNTDIRKWQEIACRLAGRNLTETEWGVYLSGLTYTKTCSDLP